MEKLVGAEELVRSLMPCEQVRNCYCAARDCLPVARCARVAQMLADQVCSLGQVNRCAVTNRVRKKIFDGASGSLGLISNCLRFGHVPSKSVCRHAPLCAACVRKYTTTYTTSRGTCLYKNHILSGVGIPSIVRPLIIVLENACATRCL